MFEIKKTNLLLAMAGAAVLMAGTPVLAQDAAAPASPTPAAKPMANPPAWAASTTVS
jgi:biopolymer transport protein ExbB